MIYGFQNEHHYLSNFYSAPVVLLGLTWPTAEHAFHAMKTSNYSDRLAILNLGTPGQAKRFGRGVVLRRDWEQVKVQIMHQVVLAKFLQHDDLVKRLVATGDQALYEHNTWGDRFWGVCNGIDDGQNHLGRILMTVRDQIRPVLMPEQES